MSVLDDVYNADLARATLEELKNIFAIAEHPLAEQDYEVIPIHGQVSLKEGGLFTMSRRKLRMVGYCEVCGMDAYSTPIRRLADIADQLREFNWDKSIHKCMDL